MIHCGDTETRSQRAIVASFVVNCRSLSTTAFWLVVLLVAGMFVGCDDSRKALVSGMTRKTVERNANVKQALYAALTTSTNVEVQAWREFLNEWPSGQQSPGFAWHEEVKRFQGNVSASTLIEDRYVLKVILDFEMSPDFQKVTFTKLRFHFAEVKRVDVPPEGAGAGGFQFCFSPTRSCLDWMIGSGWVRRIGTFLHWVSPLFPTRLFRISAVFLFQTAKAKAIYAHSRP